MKTRAILAAIAIVSSGLTAATARGPEPAPAHQPEAPARPAPAEAKAAPRAKPSKAQTPEEESLPSVPDILKMLREGNARWAANTPMNPASDPARRADLASSGQKPFVTVLTCADSRIPVERIFDRGVGEIFAVRIAGNVAGDDEVGTVEYALLHLNTPLLIVMGHTKCGAVAAAMSEVQLHGKLEGLIDHIRPAVARARRNNPDADNATLAAIAVRENVWQTVYDLLKNSSEVRELVEEHKVTIIGAVCDVATGKVEFMGEHPWQQEILGALDHAAPASPATAAVPEGH